MGSKYNISIERSFLIIITLIFVLLTIFVVKDIFKVIILSLIFAYFLNPLFNFYNQRFESKRISAILTLSTVTIGVIIPLALLSYFLILNLIKIVITYRQYIENPELLNEVIVSFLEKFSDSTFFSSFDFSGILNNIVLYILDLINNFFTSIPINIFYLFVSLFITYYLLVYNKQIFVGLNEFLPLQLKKQEEIITNISKNLKVLFKGYFLTGLIQTGVALLGYMIFGAPNLLLITFITLIVSLVPYLGTPLVWVPLGVYMILSGSPISGISLLIYGILVISTIDNFVRPILMSNKETISAPLVFIGFIGGMLAFGLLGIILGPIIISITAILLKYLKEMYENKDF